MERQWRMKLTDFPKWRFVYYYFATWKSNGIWKHLHESLVEELRKRKEKNDKFYLRIIDAR